MTGTRTGMLSRPEGGWGRARPRSPAALPAVIAVQGAALAVLAGLDGSPVWRVARVLWVIAITGLATAPGPWAARVISFLNTALHPVITVGPGTGTTASRRGTREGG